MIKFLIVFTLTVVFASGGSLLLLDDGDEYMVSNVELDFTNAHATCKRYGYFLATEKSPEETTKINAAIIASGHNATYHYIGGYLQHGDELYANDWLWYETGEALNYTNWQGNPPTMEYYCLAKSPVIDNSTTSGTWVGSICNFARYFVCETGNV